MNTARDTYNRLFRPLLRAGGDFSNHKTRRTRQVDHLINERASLARRVARVRVGDEVGITRSGMDCDCSRYSYGFVQSVTTVVALWKLLEDHERSLDGPCSTHLVTPDEARGTPRESRDLALEAFEDGHPHVVYA